MYTHFRPEQNHLLATLPTPEFDRLAPNLELVSLKSGQEISASGQPVSHAYFPTTSTVALLHIMENGDSSVMAVVGNEGMVGVSLFMGGGTTPMVRAVQSWAVADMHTPQHEAACKFGFLMGCETVNSQHGRRLA